MAGSDGEFFWSCAPMSARKGGRKKKKIKEKKKEAQGKGRLMRVTPVWGGTPVLFFCPGGHVCLRIRHSLRLTEGEEGGKEGKKGGGKKCCDNRRHCEIERRSRGTARTSFSALDCFASPHNRLAVLKFRKKRRRKKGGKGVREDDKRCFCRGHRLSLRSGTLNSLLIAAWLAIPGIGKTGGGGGGGEEKKERGRGEAEERPGTRNRLAFGRCVLWSIASCRRRREGGKEREGGGFHLHRPAGDDSWRGRSGAKGGKEEKKEGRRAAAAPAYAGSAGPRVRLRLRARRLCRAREEKGGRRKGKGKLRDAADSCRGGGVSAGFFLQIAPAHAADKMKTPGAGLR